MALFKSDKISQQFNSTAYQLLEKIGEGGFGHVYLAKQMSTGQSVAIKFLSINSDFDDIKRARYIERFERETFLGSRLQHPNIVRLLDKGENGDLLFAVFEYVEGKTLKDRLTESGALTAIESTEVMTQVLDALVHAHQQGVVHRDIKPANIILNDSGAKLHVKVLDFGIGTLVNEARVQDYKSITLTQETLGTPSYSSPEQLRGEPATIKTDLYVWGLVFIECLTGKPAMSGGNLASIFHKQLSNESVALPPAIVGHPLAALLRRVLQKKAHLRSVTASDLYHEILQINVANLVGCLQTENTATENGVNVAIANDDTVLNDDRITNTSHTERKQLTVLAICLNVRTIEGKEVDHEVIDALHRDQKNQCLDSALRYGAFHVGSLGDTQLFYYGYPAVSDNDARLCARTALDLISDLNKRNALLKINQGIQLDIKIGLHTGLLTCYADAIPEGDTANIALQLARLAGNEQILCSDNTQKLLQSYIEFKPLNSQTLGVSPTPIALFNLIAERQVETFGFLRNAQNNHLFIGRESELNTLTALKTTTEQCKFVHVVGEAGIGKSRLSFEFKNQSNQYTHFVAQCLPEHINNALYPILNMVKYKYSLESLSAEEAIKKITFEIGSIAEFNLTPILCAWLGYELPEHVNPSVLSPDLQKQLLFNTLIGLINKQDNGQQNLIIFEDMHWADPTTIEFINALNKSETNKSMDNNVNQSIDTDNNKNSGNLFISTSRKPLPETLVNESYQAITLNKLSEQDSKNFIHNLFDHQNVASSLLEAIVSRTDGIPLFIEELVDMLKQKGLVQHLNGITDFINSDKIDQLPNSLRDSLQQKLDSLIYSKETAQLAATIGREFDYNLLVASSNRSEAQLQTDLDELISADLILQKRRVSGDSYLFKHALVRDAAYDSSLSVCRAKLHLAIATSLETDFDDKANKQPWVVAQHYAVANSIINANKWAHKHLFDISKLSLNQEVIDDSEIVRSWLDSLDDSSEKTELTALLNHVVFSAYTKNLGWGYEKLHDFATYNLDFLKSSSKNVLNIDVDIQRTDIKYKAEWTLFAFNHFQGNRTVARELGEKLYAEEEGGNRVNKMMLATILGQAYFFDGDFLRAKKILEDVLELYDITQDLDLNIDFGFDPYLMSVGNLMSIEVMSGRIKQGVEYKRLCLEHALKTNNKATIIISYTWGTCFYFLTNDREGMKTWCDYARTNSPDIFDNEWIQRYFNMNESWTTYETVDGLQAVKEDIESGQTGILAWYEPPLADSLLANNDVEVAHTLMKNAFERSLSSGDMCVIPTTLRELARSQFKLDKTMSEKAIEYFELSIEHASKAGSHYLEIITTCYYLECLNINKQNHEQATIDKLLARLNKLLTTVNLSRDDKWVKLSYTLME